MPGQEQVVITGAGVVSPLGIGHEAFWAALMAGRCGIGLISSFDTSRFPIRLAAEVKDFNPTEFVRPRKSLKVMARDSQFALAVADLACHQAGLSPGCVDPDRFGVVFGVDPIRETLDEIAPTYRSCIVDGEFRFERWAEHGAAEVFPLSLLKQLPNMPACHVSISHDARAHSNTIQQGDVSSLLAVSEAARVIERGQADVMLAGGTSARMHPFDWVRSCLYEELSQRNDLATLRGPFDSGRDGQVRGEGAAALLLESRRHAEARGARIMARVVAWSSTCETLTCGMRPCGAGLRRAILGALAQAGISGHEIGHVNAHGLGTRQGDWVEARVLHDSLPGVPVTALKSYFGNLAAASGIVELLVSVLGLEHGLIPPTLNFVQPDPQCPVALILDQPVAVTKPYALTVNQTSQGQAAAMIVVAPLHGPRQ